MCYRFLYHAFYCMILSSFFIVTHPFKVNYEDKEISVMIKISSLPAFFADEVTILTFLLLTLPCSLGGEGLYNP